MVVEDIRIHAAIHAAAAKADALAGDTFDHDMRGRLRTLAAAIRALSSVSPGTTGEACRSGCGRVHAGFCAPLDAAKLGELERLHAAATPGPWHVAAWQSSEPDRLVCAPPMPSGQLHVLAEMVTYPDAPWTVPGEDNAALIAAARNALPALIEAAREAARLREVRQRGCDCTDDEACAFARDRDKLQTALERIADLSPYGSDVGDAVAIARAALATEAGR